MQKVITLLTDMVAKGEASKSEESKIFEDYSEWADDQVRDKNYEIQTLKDTVSKLQAEIAKADADVSTLGNDIDALVADIAKWEARAKKITEEREDERAEYEKVAKDYGESIEAIGYATTVLQQQNFDRKQASSLLQVVGGIAEAKEALSAFLQNTHDITQGAPEADGYEFQSGGIINLLKKLGKKFKEELQSVDRDEANASHSYDMEIQNLRDQIQNAESHQKEKSQTQGQRKSDSGEYKGELGDTQRVLEETEKYVQNVETTFKIKSHDYKVNQDVRAEELNALRQAIEIISGGAVSGSADKHLPSLAQKSFLRSLLQTGNLRKAAPQSAAAFLGEKARSLNSKYLQMAAMQVSQGGPFDKVADMVRKLIARLESEAAEEAGHKQWCDEELKDNKLTREAKTRKTEELSTKIDKLSAEINSLGENIAELKAGEAALLEAIRKYTVERTKERETNEATIKDAKAAQVALNQALDVLKEFYEKAGGAALVQTGQVPELAKYGGQQDSNKGVVGIIEVIQSDFARLQADTESTESQSQREFEEFTEVSKADSEAKHKDAFDKGMLKDRKEHERKLTKKDYRSVSDELSAAKDYYDTLKPQCLEVHVSHEERVRLREEEIASLQQAYEILDQKQ